MGLTRRGEYAVRGMIYLAQQPAGQKVLLSEMAAAVEAPSNFLAKIMQDFSRSGLVDSSRGSGGGFSLSRTASSISLREVVEAVEGPIILNRCLIGQGTCKRDGWCQVHRVWRKAQQQMVDTLESVSIAQLARR